MHYYNIRFGVSVKEKSLSNIGNPYGHLQTKYLNLD